MKHALSIILFFTFLPGINAQHVVIANDKMNVAYAGIPNPITIAVENYKPDQVIISTDNGTLVNKGNGKYDYTPLKEGKAALKIAVKTKSGTKEIGESVYRIKWIPLPVASINRKSNYPYYLDYRTGIVAQIPDADLNLRFEVISYQVLIMSNSKIVFTAENKGAAIESYILQAISNVKSGDRIFFEKIRCMSPDKRVLMLHPIVVTL